MELEANVIHFPHVKPHKCEKSDEDEDWTDENRKEFYHAASEIHMVKLGPVTEEFLTRKKVGWAKVDFGMEFKLTDEGYYKWDSGMEIKGLPIHHLYQLLDALKTIGYENERSHYLESRTEKPVQKYLVRLVKKF